MSRRARPYLLLLASVLAIACSLWLVAAGVSTTRDQILVVLGVSGAFLVLGHVVIQRARRAEDLRRARERADTQRQDELADALQLATTQDEAQAMLSRHLERSLPGATVVVLGRNVGENRLEPASPLEEGSELSSSLEAAEPRMCVAIRLGRAHVRGTSDESLLSCGLCGALSGFGTCQPLVVAGEGIGSVLVQSAKPLEEADHRRVRESALQAAPVLANLRNAALATRRAATDALTGLPNDRSVGEMLDRMVAQTNRTLDPLAVTVLNLDSFKELNDVYGHDKGDETLAAVGAVLREAVRGSDFVGRSGGDEFLVLLPATGPEGAEKAAEKLRRAIGSITVRGVDRDITVSAGVASLPVHASDGDGLLRIADRALYVAKARGRNRVELAPMPGKGEGAALVALPTTRVDVDEQG